MYFLILLMKIFLTFPPPLNLHKSTVQARLQRFGRTCGGWPDERRRRRHRSCGLERLIVKHRGEHVTVRHGPPGQGGRTPHQSIVPALLAKEKQYCFVSSSFAVFIARVVGRVDCAMAAAGGIVWRLKTVGDV